MALVSGPGLAGGSKLDHELHTSKHVAYIKKLDTVRAISHCDTVGNFEKGQQLTVDNRGKKSWSIG